MFSGVKIYFIIIYSFKSVAEKHLPVFCGSKSLSSLFKNETNFSNRVSAPENILPFRFNLFDF